MVYDASPLVRSELAVALARLVRGHMPLLEDAILRLRVRGGGAGGRWGALTLLPRVRLSNFAKASQLLSN